jgi:hypothetical protein
MHLFPEGRRGIAEDLKGRVIIGLSCCRLLFAVRLPPATTLGALLAAAEAPVTVAATPTGSRVIKKAVVKLRMLADASLWKFLGLLELRVPALRRGLVVVGEWPRVIHCT